MLSIGLFFYPLLINIPLRKFNGGILHMPGGIINRFYAEIRRFCRTLGNNSEWIKFAREVDDNGLPALSQLVTVNGKQTAEYKQLYDASKSLRFKAQKAQTQKRKLEERMEKQMDDVESTEGDQALLTAWQQASEATELAIDAADKLAEKALKDCYDHANLQTKFAHGDFRGSSCTYCSDQKHG